MPAIPVMPVMPVVPVVPIAKRTVVFILSERQSGSTWLSYVLGSHASASHLGEYRRPFTMPGHVACRLCEARSQPCPIFHDIHSIPLERAFDYAFERLGSNCLIDCSKQLSWISRFALGENGEPRENNFDLKVVHLLRDPRGWFASQLRRSPLAAVDAIATWQKTNREIAHLIQQHRLHALRVLYDDLTGRPADAFPRLCDFLGFDFQPAALHYWNKEHHGLGGNGAAFSLLGSLPQAKVTTGDDAFYQQQSQQMFCDDRWRRELKSSDADFLGQDHWLAEFP